MTAFRCTTGDQTRLRRCCNSSSGSTTLLKVGFGSASICATRSRCSAISLDMAGSIISGVIASKHGNAESCNSTFALASEDVVAVGITSSFTLLATILTPSSRCNMIKASSALRTSRLSGMAPEYDLVVIGGGSGGLACAQRAAEFGARALVIERHRLGGTCVNVGCVPKKVMWNAGQIAHALHDAPDYGFQVSVAPHDWAQFKRKRDEYVAWLNSIYERNLERRQVELLRQHARLRSAQSVQVGARLITAGSIVLATGSAPSVPTLPGAALGLTSDGFFELETRPQRVAIVGGGYVAAELAGIFGALGSDTSVIL